MPEPVGRCELDAETGGDVAGVDPRLRQPGGGEGAGGDVAGHPLEAVARLVREEALAEVGARPLPALVDLGRGPAALVHHHDLGALVDVGGRRGAFEEPAEDRVELAPGAPDGHLVGLGQVQDDVADRPALAGRRPAPTVVIQVDEQTGQLVLLLLEEPDDLLHAAEPT